MNYLSEPYGCIIDMDEGVSDDGIVVGTGPYVATELVTDDHLNLVKNENYWDGDVNMDEITVRTISDGDTFNPVRSMRHTVWLMQAIRSLKMIISISPVYRPAVLSTYR